MFVYYSMEHRGGLKESLETRKEITEEKFKWWTQYNHYEFYCYDNRINCLRFIKNKIDDGCDNPTWLLIEVI